MYREIGIPNLRSSKCAETFAEVNLDTIGQNEYGYKIENGHLWT